MKVKAPIARQECVHVETFLASFKKERIYLIDYKDEEDLRVFVFEYIEVWYNRKRKHFSDLPDVP